ncbi:myxococcus cysteine-rich repeat containing protein [Leptospira sp. WS39.C2]
MGCQFLEKENNEDDQNSILTLVAAATQNNLPQEPETYQSVGGNLTGQLNGGTVVFQLNGTNNLSISAVGTFVFTSKIKSNSNYTVSVFTNPNGITCGITNKATGNISTTDITDIIADCTICGNGVKLSYEACDDGNLTNGDGCNNSCRIESGYSCNNSSPTVCVSI